jgi:hypothetical protein
MFGDNTALILFMIMLLGLLLCSFLGGAGCSKDGFSNYVSGADDMVDSSSDSTVFIGGRFIENYDNYNHYTKESYPSIFYGPNGETAKVIQSDSGNSVVITTSNGDSKTFVINNNNNGTTSTSSSSSATVYYGPNGMSAIIITDKDGNKAIQVTDSNNKVVVYSVNQPYSSTVTTNNNNNNNNSSYTPYQTLDANTVTSSEVNNASTINGLSSSLSSSSSSYDQYLPPGIPKSDIPPGDEDLYILKSQVVPPVCPACPAYLGTANSGDTETSSTGSGSTSSGSGSNKKCPPCPACDRCPEPAYDCKLVPNYSNFNSDYMPAPVLSSFSTFGM